MANCPGCGHELVMCQYGDGCKEWAEYDCWFKRALLVRLMVCKDHAKLSEAYKQKGEAAFQA